MHGTQRQVDDMGFERIRNFLARSRQVQKRRFQLYMRILAVVEEKVGQEALINKHVIARAIGIDDKQVGDTINAHPHLARIICEHQRRHGCTSAQRIKMQGAFIPCQP